MRILKSITLIALVLIIFSCQSNTIENLIVISPNGNISAKMILIPSVKNPNENHLAYSVAANNKDVIGNSPIRIELKDMAPLGNNLILVNKSEKHIDETWERVWGRSKTVQNNYFELTLNYEEIDSPNRKLDILVRAYDDGIAFRYNLPEQPGLEQFKISSENISFNFSDTHTIWAAEYGFVSHQEAHFNKMKISDVDDKIMGLPLLVKIQENQWAAIAEANLTDWAGMYLSSQSDSSLITRLAPRYDDSTIVVKSKTVRQSPWRVIMLGNSAGSFLESNIIQNLNEPNSIEDVSWIKPGKSAWDWWWSHRYAPDADFKLGSNNETMKYFIDFASDMGWDYQLIDWHWYGEPFERWEGETPITNHSADILTDNPEIDIPMLVEYATEKNVKLLVWLEWSHADKQMEEAFPLYEKWGVAGIKVDFMQREDQEMVNFYHRLVKLAAKHHLVVDFHGAYKPTGISRTYPNLITREGVLGNEYTKWSELITPEHNTTIAFTRNLLGEMDYTPGAFVNVAKKNFKTEEESPYPMVMNTRTHQLAMMIVYESALQILCDSPYNYQKSPAGLNFLKEVPTTWDETKFIHGEIGEYITVARRSGDTWYVGTLNNSLERKIKIELGFLSSGQHSARIWKDASDANHYPHKLDEIELNVNDTSIVEINLAIGGGCVMVIKNKNKIY